MRNKQKVKINNSQQFIKDIQSVRDIMVVAPLSNIFLKVLKKDVLKKAEYETIKYHLSNEVFVVERTVMIII